ncbi:sulfur reduction protein DsrE [Robertkochia sediminum]|uniref:sulfur reduction protein DsrE n=1 Tax=Robertkochia sediminum TaxID=2785326 RepID=UPI0019349918|nr:sulfur reduction protein DsrE [Robertkochia sediminum]MBL7472186.1 sulfur reduction protein DsrE [Robertkochia sediminum]
MKTTLYTALTAILLLLSAATVNAQNDATYNYVVLTKKVPQLQPILITAEKLQEEDEAQYGEFHVVICGQGIGEITDPEKINKFIARANQLGVKLIACGFSLNKFKVDRAAVPKEMEIVENGILYNFQLQKKGFISLGL